MSDPLVIIFKIHHYALRTTVVIVDSEQRIIAVCVGVPDGDQTWESVHHRAAEALKSARHRLCFKTKEKKHRRGKFSSLGVGISHGGGQRYPKILQQSKGNEEILTELLKEEAFQRISGFMTGGIFSQN